jgi:hypothetical protein
MSLLDQAVEQLSRDPLADVGQLLKAGGRVEVEQQIARAAARGLRAHVLIVGTGEDLTPLHVLWDKLGYKPETDLLLLFNGRRWEARGWALSPTAVDSALSAATPALHQYFGKGLVTALANLAEATKRNDDPPASAPSASGLGLGVGAAVALGAVGWVIVRRQRRARERRQTLAEARSSAEKVFTDILIAAEELDGPDAVALREKATRLRDQMDALVPPGQKQLPAKEESLTMAQLHQMENELEALRSSVLQAKRRS